MKLRDEIILTISALKIGYKAGNGEKVVLQDLNATARKGELIAIIGKNGAGKSTIFNLITGNLKPTEGTISIKTGSSSD